MDYAQVVELAGLDEPMTDFQAIRQLEIQVRYEGYIERQQGGDRQTANAGEHGDP